MFLSCSVWTTYPTVEKKRKKEKTEGQREQIQEEKQPNNVFSNNRWESLDGIYVTLVIKIIKKWSWAIADWR